MHPTEQVIVVDQHVRQQAPPAPVEVFVLHNHYALLEPIVDLPLKLQGIGEGTPPELPVRLLRSQHPCMPIRHVGSGTGGLSGIRS